MSEQKRTEAQKSNQKVRKYAYIVLIAAAVLLVLPLPIPRIKTLYGECIRHGETAKAEIRCVELCFLLFDDRMYGNWYIQVGEDGKVIRYVMPNHGSYIFRKNRWIFFSSSCTVIGKGKVHM